MNPFEEMTRAEWSFEDGNPNCPSRLLSPHARGKGILWKIGAEFQNVALRLPADEPQRGAGPVEWLRI